MSQSQVNATLDHLFRRESGKIVAYLTKFLGTGQIDLAEAVVQESLLKAVQTWPLQGIPDNPGGWILRVAKNAAIDHLRQNKKIAYGADEVLQRLVAPESEHNFENEVTDDQLKLIFICCHPELTRESRLALTLKTLCGFSVKEIAKAFLAKEETIAQRIVRAKQKISDEHLIFEVPSADEISARLDSVLEVLYLLFNEGYSATDGNFLIRQDLCEEAIYRLKILSQHPLGRSPKVYALLSLMYFQSSRFNSRIDSEGEILLLEEQDRSLWNGEHIAAGLKYMELSAEGEELSDYHLQAGIASCHALAPSFEETDWEQILKYYDLLMLNSPSPIVALNRCVAIAMLSGSEKALAEIKILQELPALKSYYLLPATIAELHRRMKNWPLAIEFYKKALGLVGTEPEKKLIEKRIKSCSENLL